MKGTNRIDKFRRSPSKAEEYQRFKDYLKSNNISSTAILLGEDLNWAKVDSNYKILETYLDAKSDKLLNHKDDIKIILNKFPYNFEPNVTHLLIWTKVPIEADPDCPKGDISSSTRKLINKYVQKTFVQGLGIPPENIVWFRNWRALQSIKDLSHIHVLVKDLPSEQLHSILNTPGAPLENSDYIEAAQL